MCLRDLGFALQVQQQGFRYRLLANRDADVTVPAQVIEKTSEVCLLSARQLPEHWLVLQPAGKVFDGFTVHLLEVDRRELLGAWRRRGGRCRRARLVLPD